MTSARFVRTLARHLALFQATAALLAKANLLGQPTTEIDDALLQNLVAYAWAVRSRALWLAPPNPPALPGTGRAAHPPLRHRNAAGYAPRPRHRPRAPN